MSTAQLAKPDNNRPLPEALEQVVVSGDLSKLSAADRVRYYQATCQSLGLNPLTRPFAYLQLSGKLTLYATRDCADQLAKLHQVSLSVVARDRIEDVYLVHARATTPDGRSVEDLGAVALGSKRGDDLANALMKAQTKAYRRATLRICGLGWLDETELETIHDAQPVADSEQPTAPAQQSSGPALRTAAEARETEELLEQCLDGFRGAETPEQVVEYHTALKSLWSHFTDAERAQLRRAIAQATERVQRLQKSAAAPKEVAAE